jgi:hypothetical protein
MELGDLIVVDVGYRRSGAVSIDIRIDPRREVTGDLTEGRLSYRGKVSRAKVEQPARLLFREPSAVRRVQGPRLTV